MYSIFFSSIPKIREYIYCAPSLQQLICSWMEKGNFLCILSVCIFQSILIPKYILTLHFCYIISLMLGKNINRSGTLRPRRKSVLATRLIHLSQPAHGKGLKSAHSTLAPVSYVTNSGEKSTQRDDISCAVTRRCSWLKQQNIVQRQEDAALNGGLSKCLF